MRYTTYSLENAHAIEIKPYTHNSARSIFSQIFHGIIHMSQVTYILGNTHAI